MKVVQSLSLKVWLPLLVLITFMFLWMYLLVNEFRGLNAELIETSEQSIRQNLTILQSDIENETSKNDSLAAKQALVLRARDPHYQILVAINSDSTILYSTELALTGLPLANASTQFKFEHFEQMLTKNEPLIEYHTLDNQFVGYMPLQLPLSGMQGRSMTTGALFFVYDISVEKTQLWQKMWRTIVPIGVGLLLIMFLLFGFLDYFVARPIQHLIASAKAIANENPDIRCNIQGHGEIANLGKAFDEMAGQLKFRHEQRQDAEKALKRSENQKRDLLNSTSAVVYIKDCDGHYMFVNKMFESIFNISNEEIRGKTDFDIFPSEVAEKFRINDIKAAQVSHPLEIEEEALQEDGLHTYLSTKFSLKNENNEVYATYGISSDITERKRAEEKFIQQAHYDTLTNLPNRMLALDRLSQMLIESKRDETRFAILFIDLDDFKKVNDSLGHDVGDHLLVIAGKRLKKTLRETDTVARLGGDEFIVLLRHLKSNNDTVSIIESILTQFKRPFLINSRELIITASVGIAIYPNDGEGSSELLRNADSAMYNAKAIGRNTYSFFTDSMNQQVSRRLELEEQMHYAVQRGEFTVVYQPQINVSTNEVIGAEALLRWHNELLGNISPVEFIPVAEQTGMIDRLGEFVLTEALITLSDWQKQHKRQIRMAVNLSPIQFRDAKLVDIVKKAIRELDVNAENLELEITEGVLLSGHSFITKALTEFNRMGISLAMDDFGTGYSSISYLRSYPFDILKIDKSFIQDMTHDQAVLELVNATIVMAHALNIKVVAEGVETQEQLACLHDLCCDYAQGFYLSKPLSKINFLKYTIDLDNIA